MARGYGLIQPRIGSVSRAPTAAKFARIMAGPAGLDTYTTAVDVYQDYWFAQGVFTGKGIYDVAAARQRLAVIPENSVLSHDLLEGARCARAGHRPGTGRRLPPLTRLCPAPPPLDPGRLAAGGGWRKSPLGLLNRWQILDNLRRSLVPPALLALLAAG